MAHPFRVPRGAAALTAAALALSFIPTAVAASDPEVDAIREELRALRQSYDARLKALEERLKDAEARAAAPPAAVAAPAPPAAPAVAESPAPPAPASAGGSSGIAAFNPAISAVLQGTYAHLSQDPNQYRLSGFLLDADVSPGRRGLNLGESEVALSANVDDKFAGNLIVSLTPQNTVEVEEAYGIVTALPYGLTPKFGRFFSGIGYLNEQHQHAWDFVDAPLAYNAFLGGQYDNDGLQLKWIAPTDQYLELGAEIGNGDNFPGTDRNTNAVNAAIAYAHTGGDIGDSHSWRAGVSYLHTRAQDRDSTVTDAFARSVDTGFSGTSDVAMADFVWKYAPHGNAQETNFKLQGEYIWRREHGDLTYDRDDTLGLMQTAAYRSSQNGWYLQGVWQFMPYWRVGARYDRLDPGSPDYGANGGYLDAPVFHPERYTLMVDWTPSEFSRLRLQVAQSRNQAGVTDHQLFVQYILTLGAHGAHKF
ncbi:MAG TPA: TonB-dependent receptor [Casimicrobiaceae bacterium]|nr:TonB-dependent receptor [Casimicrobiaceae bacterium]